MNSGWYKWIGWLEQSEYLLFYNTLNQVPDLIFLVPLVLLVVFSTTKFTQPVKIACGEHFNAN